LATETGFAAPLPPMPGMPPLVAAPWAYPMAMQQQALIETPVGAIPWRITSQRGCVSHINTIDGRNPAIPGI